LRVNVVLVVVVVYVADAYQACPKGNINDSLTEQKKEIHRKTRCAPSWPQMRC